MERLWYKCINPFLLVDAFGQHCFLESNPSPIFWCSKGLKSCLQINYWLISLQEITVKKNERFFGAIGDQKDSTRGVPEGGCAPLCNGGSKGALAPSPVGKSGGPTTLPNSLNISRNALFLNTEAVSEEILNIFPIGSYVKTMSADGILVGGRVHQIQFWKGTT